MSVTLPLDSTSPHFTFRTVLDETTFGFEFFWNARAGEAGEWCASLFDSDGAPLVSGVTVVVDWPMFLRTKDAHRPAGLFQFVDTSGEHRPPGETDLGSRVVLLYFSPSELGW